MPSYYIKDKDGFEIELNGKSPPTEKDIDQILGAQKIKDAKKVWQAQRLEKSPKTLAEVSRLGAEAAIANLQQKPDFVQGARKMADIATKVAPYAALPLSPLVSAPVTGVSRMGQGLLGGEDLRTASRKGLKAGAADLVTGSILGGVAKLGKGAINLPPVKKGLSAVGEALTGVSSKLYRKALSNPAILNTKETFKDVGKMAKQAYNRVLKESGIKKTKESRLAKQWDKEQGLVKKGNKPREPYDIDQFVSRQKSLLNKKRGVTGVYTAKEKKDINNILTVIKREKTADGQLSILDKIDAKRSLYKEGGDTRTSKGDRFLRKIASDMRGKLKKAVPGVSDIRDYNFEVANLRNVLGNKLGKTKSDPSKLFSRTINETEQDALEALSKLDPKKSPFLDVAEDLKVKDSFSRLTPEGTFGDRIARGIVGATTGTLPIFSPFIHKMGIKGAAALPKLTRPLGPIMGQVAAGPIEPQRTIADQPSRTAPFIEAAPYIDTAARLGGLGGKVATRELFNAPKVEPSGRLSPQYFQKLRNERGIR